MGRLLLSNTLNTRDLGGYVAEGKKVTKHNMFLRSDVPVKLTDEDIKLLLDNGITTIIDLRNHEEVKNSPCAFKENKDFQYYHCKVHGDGRLPKTVESVPTSYFEMIDEQKSIFNIMKILANVEGGVLYHCTAGKDRTGVITALLLLLAGVSKTDILTDYGKSKEYLNTLLQSFCEINKNVDINIITPKEKYMEKFLEMFNNKYNSVEEYLLQIGVTSSEIIKLKEKLV